MEKLEHHVPGWVCEKVGFEELTPQSTGSDGSQHIVSRNGFDFLPFSFRRHARICGQSRESLCNAAHLIAQAEQLLGLLIWTVYRHVKP
jgi:hypothetical protein